MLSARQTASKKQGIEDTLQAITIHIKQTANAQLKASLRVTRNSIIKRLKESHVGTHVTSSNGYLNIIKAL